ncbi:MAG TPA: hypothetical protein DF613_06440 [Lachnospiraceae bacterium]|nr:hypothetical protein [Lachnospiraceae bacterium]
MKRDKQQSSFVNIGSSSLLVIFLILCLATFAILSLSSAQNDYSFSQRLAEHRSVYYEAASKAEEILAEVDRTLAQTAADSENSAAYIQAVTTALNGAEVNGIALSCQTENEETTISYQVPAGGTQALQVILGITNYEEKETYYDIKTWQTINTRAWELNDTLELAPIIK